MPRTTLVLLTTFVAIGRLATGTGVASAEPPPSISPVLLEQADAYADLEVAASAAAEPGGVDQ